MACCAVIVAAGKGRRAGAPKQFSKLCGQTVLRHAVSPFLRAAAVCRVRVVVAAEMEAVAAESLGDFLPQVELLPKGGGTRAASVRAGLFGLADNDWAAVHDAARPCLGDAALARLLTAVFADEVGGLLSVPVSDSLKCGEGGRMKKTAARGGKFLAQTPQVFRAGLLRAALSDEDEDEARAVENAGYAPLLVEGEAANIKITCAEDFALAAAILSAGGRGA